MTVRTINPRNWYGTLTQENAEQVAQALRDLLEGRYFTTVSCNSHRFERPEVYPSQRLDPDGMIGKQAIKANFFPATKDYDAFMTIGIHDSYGSWSISEGSYIVFTYDSSHHEVRIVQSDRGDRGDLVWVFAVEDHTEY